MIFSCLVSFYSSRFCLKQSTIGKQTDGIKRKNLLCSLKNFPKYKTYEL